MWTNGEIDPLQTLGVQSTTKINANALNRPSTANVLGRDVSPLGDDVFGLVYTGPVYRQDLALSVNRPTPVEVRFELFGRALGVWLPCFKGSRGFGFVFCRRTAAGTSVV